MPKMAAITWVANLGNIGPGEHRDAPAATTVEHSPAGPSVRVEATRDQGSKLRAFWSQMRLKFDLCDLKIYLGVPVRL